MGKNTIDEVALQHQASTRMTMAEQALLAARTEQDILRLVGDFPDVPFRELAAKIIWQVSPQDAARILALALKALAR